MEINKILNADVLDIIFDGRNKEYGAYSLRKNYNKRLATALIAMGSVLMLFFVGSVLANALHGNKPKNLEVAQEVQLTKVEPPKKQEVIPPPVLPKAALPPKIETVKITPPRIVPDEEVRKDEMPPEVEKAETAKISSITQEGIKDDGIIAPPVEKGDPAGAIAPKVAVEDYEKVFTKVEKAATFPGGLNGWKRFLESNLQYPESATDAGRQGVISVQLVVDKDGNVSEVKALNPEIGADLAAEAERVIKKGPKWIPAEQNGRYVTYRFVQKITFQLNN